MTSDALKHPAWKRLLDACDHLVALAREREEKGRPAGEEVDPLPAARAAALTAASDPTLDTLFDAKASGTPAIADPNDRLVLALLAQRYVASKSPAWPVRELVAVLADSTIDRLEWGHRILQSKAFEPNGPAVLEPSPDNSEFWEAQLRLSSTGLHRASLGGPTLVDAMFEKVRSEGELLARLHELTYLYERRAERVFDREGKSSNPPRPTTGNQEEREELRRDALELSLSDLLDEDPELPFRSPLLEIVWKYRLSYEEFYIVGFLLLSEVIDGDAWQSSARTLCLLANDETELWDLRHLLDADAPLRKHGLIVVEEMIDGRPLTAEIALSTWVMQRIAARAASTIKPDERIDFHLYLKDLGDSEAFYRRLDAEKGQDER